jgi:hypothetical protein
VRKILYWFAALAIGFLTLTVARPAMATDDGTIHLESKCSTVASFYVNSPDEGNRRPTTGEKGLTFSASDLIHHSTDTTLEKLTHGTFVAIPAPDQPSFFSVEVSGDGKYGTLRWNPSLGTSGEWEATSQGQQYHDPDPATLADKFPIHLSHHVFSFGVGYTANPPGTVTTLVTSVTFGDTYDLTCAPKPTETATSKPTATATATQTKTAKPSASHSSAAGAVGTGGGTSGGALAITGSSTWPLVGFAAAALALGGGLFLLTRKRRAKFVA